MSAVNLTPLEALLIVKEYGPMQYKGRAADFVVSQAHKVLTEEATNIMHRETGGLCSTCWGDGWHKPRLGMLQGACETCNGTGKAPHLEGDRA